MERTINGKTLEQVISELQAPFAQQEFKDNPAGYIYLPYESYRKRIDSVIGVFGYDFTITQTDWVIVGEKSHISCIGTLSLRDDAGNIVVVKSATGDADVIYRNSDGAVVKSGNDAKTAANDAFKSCCRMLGIGDEQLRAKRTENRKNSSPDRRNTNSSPASRNEAEEETLRVVVRGSFKSLSGKGYKAPAVIKETGEQVSLVLWKEGIEEVTKYMPLAEFLEKYRDKEFSIIAKRNVFQKKNGSPETQVVMLRPYCRKEAG